MDNYAIAKERPVRRTIALLSLFAISAACAWPQESVTAKRIVGPRYPALARIALVQGKVELLALISRDGSVQDIRKLSGHDLLVPTAKDALSKWSFTKCGSSSGVCEAKVVFLFKLQREPCDVTGCPPPFEVDLPDTIIVRAPPPIPIVDRAPTREK